MTNFILEPDDEEVYDDYDNDDFFEPDEDEWDDVPYDDEDDFYDGQPRSFFDDEYDDYKDYREGIPEPGWFHFHIRTPLIRARVAFTTFFRRCPSCGHIGHKQNWYSIYCSDKCYRIGLEAAQKAGDYPF